MQEPDQDLTEKEETHTLYRHYDKANILLYVGISLSAVHRLGQHAQHAHWFKSIANVTIEHCASREDSLAKEKKAIRMEGPLHNVVHNNELLDARDFAKRAGDPTWAKHTKWTKAELAALRRLRDEFLPYATPETLLFITNPSGNPAILTFRDMY